MYFYDTVELKVRVGSHLFKRYAGLPVVIKRDDRFKPFACFRSAQVSVKELKNRELWSAGWRQREDLEWSGDPHSPEGAVARPKSGTSCVVCDGEGRVPCARRGCAMGLERVQRQKEVVAKTEKQFKRVLRDTKGRADGDEATRDMRRRMKRQLKDMSKADGPRRNRGKKSSAAANNGDEDWGAYGRARRDEKLERWMRGGEVSNVDPEDNQ